MKHRDAITPRLQDVLVFSWTPAGVRGIALNQSRVTFSALLTPPIPSTLKHIDTQIWFWVPSNPNLSIVLLFVQFTVSKGGETEGDLYVAGKSPCFKDK